ncbi:hypothetical protein BDV35DRAFT_370257 [Aspergillus flavus]|uniref:Uncharacterized protein n=1 Tax=Aspergillus flavus TaxID=5059 RepID=A0A5N6GIK6_ASPFL|nr:hypothetical protein BDV35DRAFT_370257 [Aspergillus flavus]
MFRFFISLQSCLLFDEDQSDDVHPVIALHSLPLCLAHLNRVVTLAIIKQTRPA